MELGSTEWKNIIREGAKEFNIYIDQKKIDQFAKHAVELIKWNKKINLTAITDPVEIAVKHFVDSTASLSLIPHEASLIDIGSGGGFPGIPIKILIPSLSVTLIDGSRKKVNFLKHVIRTLDLKNIKACHVRAKDLAKNSAFANSFDIAICRALAALDHFVSMALPLLAKNGSIIAMKGGIAETEVESLRLLSSVKEYNFSVDLKKYTLPRFGAERSIVCVKRKNSDFKKNMADK